MGITYEEEAPTKPKITYEERRAPSSNTDVAINAANKGAASLPDSILNTPNNILNLLKAGAGTMAGLAGRPDLMPELTPNPDLARRGMESVGLINPAVQPQGTLQKAIDYGVQGAVGGGLTGGSSVAKTAVGAGMGALSGLAAGGTQEATGNPALAATAGMLPAAAGLRPSGVTPVMKSGNPVLDKTFANGNAEGLVVPPSAMKNSWLGDRVEGLAGKAALNQATALKNQPVINNIARREAGLPANEPLTIETLRAARERIAAPYAELETIPGRFANSSLPLPTPKELVHDWKSNNSRITELWKDYNKNSKVETLDAIRAAESKKKTLEINIDKAATEAGRPDLVPALRKARVELAKNFTVERALNLGNGNIDASVLGRLYDHGAPLTGGLENIAKFQQSFPSSTREASKVPAPGVSKLEGWGALALGLGGHAVMPGGGLLAALPLAVSPAARSFALSPFMQGGRSFGPGLGSEVAAQTSPIVTNGILSELYRRQNQ